MSTDEETLIDTITEAMEEHGIRPTQQIDTLLKAIEEEDDDDGQDESDEDDDDDDQDE